MDKTTITIGSDFSGVGAFNLALQSLNVSYKEIYACDYDEHARKTFILNHGTKEDYELVNTKEHKNYANGVKKIIFSENISEQDVLFLKEANEFAKQFSFYYPFNVYDREIPEQSFDVYMTSPPCQAFSLAGKRLGKEDKRGILFFNSLEFIKKNQPKSFIFENVKGLLSDDKVDKKAIYGRTFQEWSNYLGGKSVNGVPTIFPYEDSVPYHIYFDVLNAKHYGVPQNRERVFIVGIREDQDSNFIFPKPFPLTTRLKDVLEKNVPEKYFLSDKMLEYFDNRSSNFNSGKINYKDEESIASAITSSSKSLDISDNIIRLANVNPSGNGMNGNVFYEDGVAPTLSTNKGEGIKIGTWRTHEDGRGFRETEDNMCPTIPARAREDGSGQPVIKITAKFGNKRLNETLNNKNVPNEDCIIDSYNKTFHTEVSPTIQTTVNTANMHHVKITEPQAGAIRGRNEENPKSRKKGIELKQIFEKNEDPTISNTLTTVNKDNVVVVPDSKIIGYTRDEKGKVISRHLKDISGTLHTASGGCGSTDQFVLVPSANSKGYEKAEEDSINLQQLNSETRRGRVGKKVAQTLDTSCNQGILIKQRIRRLTPRECWRLMGFPETFKAEVSDSQQYKQAGNSIVVKPLALLAEKIIKLINN